MYFESFKIFIITQGQIVGLVMSGMLVNSPSVKLGTWEVGRWDSCFYASAAFGFIWFPFYYYFTYDCPSEHPRMTDEEYDFIRKGVTSAIC